MKFEDLRGILQYVPQFRERIFVIALDGAVMRLPNFPSLLQDIAVLQSLSIQIALVFGARQQIQELAAARGVTLSNDDGMGRTDQATLDVSADAISRLTSELVADLTALELRVAVPNALAVHPAGVIDGVDLEHTGRIERVDERALHGDAPGWNHPGAAAAGLRQPRQHAAAELRRDRRGCGAGTRGREGDLRGGEGIVRFARGPHRPAQRRRRPRDFEAEGPRVST